MTVMIAGIRVKAVYEYMEIEKDICCETVDRDSLITESIANLEIELWKEESVFGSFKIYQKGKVFEKQWVFKESKIR